MVPQLTSPSHVGGTHTCISLDLQINVVEKCVGTYCECPKST